MEHRSDADLRAQMPWVGGNGGERLSGGAEQDRIEGGFVLEGDLCASHSARASPWHLGQWRLQAMRMLPQSSHCST